MAARELPALHRMHAATAGSAQTTSSTRRPSIRSRLASRRRPGYLRVAVEPGSFAEWLRGLPLAAPGTPVLNHSGDVVYPGDDPYVAAVVAIDVGAGDLQQSSDAVIRLHGEWLWASDQPGAISYKSTTKLDMPFSRWAKGQRLLAAGPNMGWVVKGKPKEATYNDFRQYIDAVMLWSNNVSLAMRASPRVRPSSSSLRVISSCNRAAKVMRSWCSTWRRSRPVNESRCSAKRCRAPLKACT